MSIYVHSNAHPECVSATVERLQKELPLLNVRKADFRDLPLHELTYARAVVLPGAESTARMLYGMGAGAANVTQAVQNHGVPLLATCAGAYAFSARTFVYGQLAHKSEQPIFTGEARLEKIADEPKPTERTVTLETGEVGAVPYNMGPSFYNYPKGSLLARYRNGSAAALHLTHGRTNAVFSGVHPEMAKTDFTQRMLRLMLQKLKLVLK